MSDSTVAKRPMFWNWLKEGLGWRWRALVRRIQRAFGVREIQWARVVMDRETESFVRSLDYRSLKVLEIAGNKWRDFGFASYRSVHYPDYDVCARPLEMEGFDLVIAEQVFEHLLWPYRAARHVWSMLRPGGVFIVTTPFLLRVHNHPVDCSRWTELGLRHLLAEGGFSMDAITTGAWGNRSCVRGNFRRWVNWISWLHSLENEADFPVVVWAFARRQQTVS